LRLFSLRNMHPRQARTRQPWAGGRNPVGIGRTGALGGRAVGRWLRAGSGQKGAGLFQLFYDRPVPYHSILVSIIVKLIERFRLPIRLPSYRLPSAPAPQPPLDRCR
jgi:hypothetical protein